MARIGIDLDGPCYNFIFVMREHLLRTQMHRVPTEDEWFGIYNGGLPREEFEKLVTHAGEAAYMGGGPEPGVVEAFNLLRGAGHTLHIVTARPAMFAQWPTTLWLHEHGLLWDSLTFSRDKTIVPVDYFIDDLVENYDNLDAVGVQVYLVNFPHNVAYKTEGEPRRRVDSLLDFAEIVVRQESSQPVAR